MILEFKKQLRIWYFNTLQVGVHTKADVLYIYKLKNISKVHSQFKTLGYLPRVLFFNAFELGTKI
jgi:hypothetical protein